MIYRFFSLVLLASALAACGTFQIGIEPVTTPLPAAATATAIATETQLAAVPDIATATARPPERINFPVGGTNFTFTTHLDKSVPDRYVLQVLAQQKMTITSSTNVSIEVFNTDDKLVGATTAAPGQWLGTIPQTGDYIIVLHGDGFVTVTIAIPAPGS